MGLSGLHFEPVSLDLIPNAGEKLRKKSKHY